MTESRTNGTNHESAERIGNLNEPGTRARVDVDQRRKAPHVGIQEGRVGIRRTEARTHARIDSSSQIEVVSASRQVELQSASAFRSRQPQTCLSSATIQKVPKKVKKVVASQD